MSNTAEGTISGFIFQFEKALLMLSETKKSDDVISIESVDDVAAINKNSVIIAVQAKHSVSPTGNTFQDTSYALWRTLQIWIKKIEEGVFNSETRFICCTNKEIDKSSLLYNLVNNEVEHSIRQIKLLKKEQEEKLNRKKSVEQSAGKSIERVLKIINSVLRKRKILEQILNNLQINVETNIKDDFLNNLRFNIENYTKGQRDKIYQEFYGWIISRSQAKWKNAKHALFSKEDFDNKYYEVINNPSIVNLVFRAKKDLIELVPLQEHDIENKYTELFVKQIEDIQRRPEAKERIIREAIKDFLFYTIEQIYIIEDGNYTAPDLEEFEKNCYDVWRDYFDNTVIHEIDSYNEREKNELAINIFNEIMSGIRLKFKNNIEFNLDNIYFQKGCFLHLSNIPRIGWHPEWVQKYSLKNDKQ